MRSTTGRLHVCALAAVLLAGGWAAHGLAAPLAEAAATRFAPRLLAEQQRYDRLHPKGLLLQVSQSKTEPAMSRLSLLVPSQYQVETQPRGRRVGDVEALLVPPAGLGAHQEYSGTLEFVEGTEVDRSCVATPIGVMEAVLGDRVRGDRLRLRVILHRVGKGRRLTICFPEAKSLPNSGVIRRLSLHLVRGVVPPGVGKATWKAFFTPRAGGSKAATESRGVVLTPSYLTLARGTGSARVKRGALVRLRGVLALGTPQGKRRVQILAGPSPSRVAMVGRARTTADGRWTARVRLSRTLGLLYVQARAPSRSVRCRGRSAEAPKGCTSATEMGISSNVMRVRVVS